MTVATVAAPPAAGKCLPYEDGVTTLEAPKLLLRDRAERRFRIHVRPGVTPNGSDSNDYIESNVGTFSGGPGDDEVPDQNAGTFNGGPGDDVADTMNGGTFAGGGGTDAVLYEYRGGTCYSVESSPKTRQEQAA